MLHCEVQSDNDKFSLIWREVFIMSNFELTTRNVRDYLMQGHYNLVGEIINDDEMTGFLCEVITDDKRSFFKIRIDDTIQFLIFEIYSGITIPEPYRNMAAVYAARESEIYKVGNIRVDMDRGDVYVHVESSFKDSAITTEAFEEMELTAYSLFTSTYDDFMQIARGSQLERKDDKKKNKLRSMFQKVHEQRSFDFDDEFDGEDIDVMDLIRNLDHNNEDKESGTDC